MGARRRTSIARRARSRARATRAATLGRWEKPTAAGATIGTIAGAAGDNVGAGLGIGAAAGAAAGLIGVLASRGPDAVLEKGTQLDMVLDRDLAFAEEEVTFQDPLRGPARNSIDGGPDPNRNRSDRGIYRGRRFPL